MDDATAIRRAREKHGAPVLECQLPPKVCQTLCALWIRRQAKGESIFDGKRLERANGIDPRPLWTHTAAFDRKVAALYGTVQKYAGQDIEARYIGGGNRDTLIGGVTPKDDAYRVKKVGEMPVDEFGKDGEGVNKIFCAISSKHRLGDIGYFMGNVAHAVALDSRRTIFRRSSSTR
jgi:hypothetical protein